MLILVGFVFYLSTLFHLCLMHGQIPQQCMKIVIVLTCKNKNGDISDSINYRPVSLATNCLQTIIALCLILHFTI